MGNLYGIPPQRLQTQLPVYFYSFAHQLPSTLIQVCSWSCVGRTLLYQVYIIFRISGSGSSCLPSGHQFLDLFGVMIFHPGPRTRGFGHDPGRPEITGVLSCKHAESALLHCPLAKQSMCIRCELQADELESRFS
jgi:hypothetical protein